MTDPLIDRPGAMEGPRYPFMLALVIALMVGLAGVLS